MKAYINLTYKDFDYKSHVKEYSKKELESLSKSIFNVSVGNVDCFYFQNENTTHYFPKKVLEESIISIVKVKDNE